MSAQPELELTTTVPYIVALAHPSLRHAVTDLVEELRHEPRCFGTPTPKLRAASLAELVMPDGLRLGVVVDGELVGMSRVDDDGRSVIAVLQSWRGRGLGRLLLEATLRLAPRHGHRRVTFRCSRRSQAFVQLAESAGAAVLDHDRSRADLRFDIERSTRIA